MCVALSKRPQNESGTNEKGDIYRMGYGRRSLSLSPDGCPPIPVLQPQVKCNQRCLVERRRTCIFFHRCSILFLDDNPVSEVSFNFPPFLSTLVLVLSSFFLLPRGQDSRPPPLTTPIRDEVRSQRMDGAQTIDAISVCSTLNTLFHFPD